MENDKIFKAIVESGIEKASPDFTQHVMAGIQRNAATAYMNNKWKLAFKLTFAIISVLLIGLSFLNAPVQEFLNPYIKLRIPDISQTTMLSIASYIFSFWLLILVSYRFEKHSGFEV